MNKYTKLVLKVIGSILLLLFFLHKINVESMLGVLREFKLYFFALMVLNMAIGLIVTYSAIIVLLRSQRRLNFFKFFPSYLLSLALGSVSPARLGDLSLAYFIKDEIEASKGLAIMLLSKIFTVSIMVVISIIGALLIWPNVLNVTWTLAMAIVAIIVIGLFILKYSKRLLLKVLPVKRIDSINKFYSTVTDLLQNHKRRILIFYIIMLIKFSLDAALAYILVRGLGADVSYPFMFFINAVSIATSLVPITLNGIGLREIVVAYLFSSANLDPNIGSSVFFSIVVTYYLMTVFFPLLYSKRFKTNDNP